MRSPWKSSTGRICSQLCAEGLVASRRYGLERTSFGVALALNTVSGATERGLARDVEATVRDYLDAGLSGREAVWAGTMLGHALMHQGRLGEANDVFLMTRRLAQRWPSRDDLGDLAETQATLAAWLGDPDASLALVEESIAALEHSQAWLIVRAIGVGLRAHGDRIERLRAASDEAAVTVAVERAAVMRERAVRWRRGAAATWCLASVVRRARPSSTLSGPGSIGEHDPRAWSEAVALERSVNWRAQAAYAGWQGARALCQTGADADVVRDAILDALADGDASRPARLALVALAAQQGIDSTTWPRAHRSSHRYPRGAHCRRRVGLERRSSRAGPLGDHLRPDRRLVSDSDPTASSRSSAGAAWASSTWPRTGSRPARSR